MMIIRKEEKEHVSQIIRKKSLEAKQEIYRSTVLFTIPRRLFDSSGLERMIFSFRSTSLILGEPYKKRPSSGAKKVA